MTEKWLTIEIAADDLSKDSVSNFLIEFGSAGNEELKDTIKSYFLEKKWNEH